ncbi:MAG: RNA polymerase II mediator complex subunit, partial [Caeruleum heppii]
MDAAMSTTFEPLSLSLRAWPEENAATNSLASLIPRITQQRGHLRNITEEGLLQEIQSSSSVPGEAQETVKGVVDDDAKVAVDDAPTRTAELMAAREDMIQRVSQAHTEAFYALDFVSLLLSKDTPRQAELSMSHHLQQHVPLGSLGVDRIQTPQIPASESADHVAVSRGWKMQGLQSTADSLLRSATRLEKEMESETKYWEQVLAIGDKGWSICRIPWERHTLGVRYGFLEATPEYRDRGLAALRRGDKGRVVLDRGRLSGQAKSVRVRMLDESGALSSVSTTPPLHLSTATTEESILNARNSIFEEELFFELGREARQLASQGVRIMDSTIHIQAGARTIIIDLVPLDDAPDLDSLDDGSVGLANAVALTLRILLSHAHRQNLHRRSEPPPPLTDRKRTLPPYSMLRPVLAHLRHQHSFTKVRNLIESFGAILKTAGLKTESVFRAASNCVSHLERSAAASQNRLQAMVELCTERVVS